MIGRTFGTLSWDGEGGYKFEGFVKASCAMDDARFTAWVEYGGASERWKQTNESDCTKGAWNDGPEIPVKFSGKLAKGEKLELRVSTWQAWKVDAYHATEKKVYTIS
ncbi:hypothetical protein [Streptomyces noursei]|uniref:hypothetical protein n=1 Tax=Streptomyces noursei TaxID=1971 RepID=UPI0035DCF26C